MPEQERKPIPKRKLRVTKQEKIGQTKKGDPIFACTCVTEQGEPVNLEFRCFQEVPIGETLEYGVKKYEHEKYGTTYTLYPPKEKLGRRVETLEKQVKELTARLDALTQGTSQPVPSTNSGGAVPADPDSPKQKEAAERFGGDDDIPF